MQSNFDFLDGTWRSLAEYGRSAEQLVEADPRACIVELGSFAEEITKHILEAEKLPDPLNQYERIELLQQTAVLSQQTADILHSIRMDRNKAVHDHCSYSSRYALYQLKNAYRLANWFAEYYGCSPSGQAFTYPLQEAPRPQPSEEPQKYAPAAQRSVPPAQVQQSLPGVPYSQRPRKAHGNALIITALILSLLLNILQFICIHYYL